MRSNQVGPESADSDGEIGAFSSHNLPARNTSFIGRTRELGQVQKLLEEHRLVTVVGPGGIGKSRLITELGYRVSRTFPDGIWLVDLSRLTDPDLVPQALAAALGIPEGPLQPLVDALCRTLADRKCLMMLDNCEHLIEACAQLAGRITHDCPNLRVLATSQEPLRLSGETLLRIAPLSVPESDERDPARIRRTESARLFAQRARTIHLDFELSGEAVLPVAEICRQLNGVPLALELAAARLRTMSLADLATGLEQRFKLLNAGDRAAHPRQQTLRGMVVWSNALLEEPQRQVLRRLAVFSGGWSREAAAHVCSLDDLTSDETLAALDALVERSLVVMNDWRGKTRYRLLETVRAFGLEQLQAVSEERAVRRRHQDWFLSELEHAPDEAIRDELAWVIRIDDEVDNVRAALDLCATEPDTLERAARASQGFWHYAESRGYIPEMIHRFEMLLALFPEGRHSAGWLLCQTLLCHGLGEQGRVEQAVLRFELIQRHAAEIDDPWALSWLRAIHIQWLIFSGHPDASALARDTLTDQTYSSFPSGPAFWLWFLGTALLAEGKPDEANDALVIAARDLPLQRERAFPLRDLGIIAFKRGDLESSERYFRESLQILIPFHDLRGFAVGIELLACLASAMGRYERCARLLGVSEMLFDRISTVSVPVWQIGRDEARDACRENLGQAQYDRLWDAGRTMSIDRAVQLALQLEERDAPTSGSDAWNRLTPRERDTAKSVGRGLSNREVAAALVVTEKTVESHITHALAKLDLRSRSQLVIWVAQHLD